MKEYLENAAIVFMKIDDGIYNVRKDRLGYLSQLKYVNTNDVIESLHSHNVLILDQFEKILFVNFSVDDI